MPKQATQQRAGPQSPLHRDPSGNDNDYGCFTKAANRKVAAAVTQLRDGLKSGSLSDNDALIDEMQTLLEPIGQGSCDTVVKENVFAAIVAEVEAAGFAFDPMTLYGW